MSSRRVVVIGAGVGGLTAALHLAHAGREVVVLEARDEPGGLASGLTRDGLSFDAGPYILLDRPGLDWAFRSLGLDLDERIPLRRIEDVYEVNAPGSPPVRFRASLEETAEGFEKTWPGSARRYTAFVEKTRAVYGRLSRLLHVSRPGPLDLLGSGALRDAPFLLRPLRSILERTGLPVPVQEAIGIWTHVAGQRLQAAPSPLAFVPSLIHTAGCFYPPQGIASIPRALAAAATAAGCDLLYGTPAREIRVERGRAVGVETDDASIDADAVVSDTGLATYLDLLAIPVLPAPATARLTRLPLQSPGVSAYLAVKGRGAPPYLRFALPGGAGGRSARGAPNLDPGRDRLCQLLVQPSVPAPESGRDGWYPARLLAPMRHADAERGVDVQRAFLEELLAEKWWRDAAGEHRVLFTRIPAEWGREFHLYRDSMNPVMTAEFMRKGRLAHRSPHVRRLYLAGSATHPGQWVSFCAISGILAAERLLEDDGG